MLVIKLRAWDKEDKRMFYFDLRTCPHFTTRGLTNYIIMLYIGLKDLTYRDVYAGDVVSAGANYPSVIEWCDHNEKISGSGWCLHELDPRHRCIYYDTGAFTTIPNKWQILGNVYENPELVPRWLLKCLNI